MLLLFIAYGLEGMTPQHPALSVPQSLDMYLFYQVSLKLNSVLWSNHKLHLTALLSICRLWNLFSIQLFFSSVIFHLLSFWPNYGYLSSVVVSLVSGMQVSDVTAKYGGLCPFLWDAFCKTSKGKVLYRSQLGFKIMFQYWREVITHNVYGSEQPFNLESRYMIIWPGLRHNKMQSLFLMLSTHLFALNYTTMGKMGCKKVNRNHSLTLKIKHHLIQCRGTFGFL